MSGADAMSLSDDVPVPVRSFVEAAATGDGEALAGVFTPDALLGDGGREFRGREGVAEWASDGPRSYELLGTKAGDTEQEVVATVLGAHGTGDLRFTLRGDEIARLVVDA